MVDNAADRIGFAIVKDLEDRAAKLKTLLEGRPAKRPLIIEFSGSPKAGKTRCISVLELFLKRNGIKVEVYTERASVSPIKAKGHLNFNVWVSCASLQGMLESLYKEIDVFVLDRGVLDALVWNDWLETAGKITREEAHQVEQFFTMKRWTDLIDIVFVLTCDPKVSIEREHADQLTTKRGTIMEEGTLTQFLASVNKTMEKNGSRFKRIVHIDTTSLKTREGVARITDDALRALSGFLDESICVVPSAKTSCLPEASFVSAPAVVANFVNTVNSEKQFVPRSLAEQNPNYLQPIPCAILRHENTLLFLKRKKVGHPLHDTYAVWAGGHVSQTDDGPDLLIKTLERELSEEVFIKEAFELQRTPVGLVRTNQDARASRHIGVLYEVVLKSQNVALALNQKEFRETRGSSMSGRLVEIGRISEFYDSMGDWSKFIVDHFWPDQSRSGKQTPTLFSEPDSTAG
jgi:predicted NUDIX family phosphoesterase/thymidylate kinase